MSSTTSDSALLLVAKGPSRANVRDARGWHGLHNNQGSWNWTHHETSREKLVGDAQHAFKTCEASRRKMCRSLTVPLRTNCMDRTSVEKVASMKR